MSLTERGSFKYPKHTKGLCVLKRVHDRALTRGRVASPSITLDLQDMTKLRVYVHYEKSRRGKHSSESVRKKEPQIEHHRC